MALLDDVKSFSLDEKSFFGSDDFLKEKENTVSNSETSKLASIDGLIKIELDQNQLAGVDGDNIRIPAVDGGFIDARITTLKDELGNRPWFDTHETSHDTVDFSAHNAAVTPDTAAVPEITSNDQFQNDQSGRIERQRSATDLEDAQAVFDKGERTNALITRHMYEAAHRAGDVTEDGIAHAYYRDTGKRDVNDRPIVEYFDAEGNSIADLFNTPEFNTRYGHETNYARKAADARAIREQEEAVNKRAQQIIESNAGLNLINTVFGQDTAQATSHFFAGSASVLGGGVEALYDLELSFRNEKYMPETDRAILAAARNRVHNTTEADKRAAANDYHQLQVDLARKNKQFSIAELNKAQNSNTLNRQQLDLIVDLGDEYYADLEEYRATVKQQEEVSKVFTSISNYFDTAGTDAADIKAMGAVKNITDIPQLLEDRPSAVMNMVFQSAPMFAGMVPAFSMYYGQTKEMYEAEHGEASGEEKFMIAMASTALSLLNKVAVGQQINLGKSIGNLVAKSKRTLGVGAEASAVAGAKAEGQINKLIPRILESAPATRLKAVGTGIVEVVPASAKVLAVFSAKSGLGITKVGVKATAATAKVATGEGLQEVSEDMIQRLVVNQGDITSLYTPEAIASYNKAFALGAVAGPVASGGIGAAIVTAKLSPRLVKSTFKILGKTPNLIRGIDNRIADAAADKDSARYNPTPEYAETRDRMNTAFQEATYSDPELTLKINQLREEGKTADAEIIEQAEIERKANAWEEVKESASGVIAEYSKADKNNVSRKLRQEAFDAERKLVAYEQQQRSLNGAPHQANFASNDQAAIDRSINTILGSREDIYDSNLIQEAIAATENPVQQQALRAKLDSVLVHENIMYTGYRGKRSVSQHRAYISSLQNGGHKDTLNDAITEFKHFAQLQLNKENILNKLINMPLSESKGVAYVSNANTGQIETLNLRIPKQRKRFEQLRGESGLEPGRTFTWLITGEKSIEKSKEVLAQVLQENIAIDTVMQELSLALETATGEDNEQDTTTVEGIDNTTVEESTSTDSDTEGSTKSGGDQVSQSTPQNAGVDGTPVSQAKKVATNKISFYAGVKNTVNNLVKIAHRTLSPSKGQKGAGFSTSLNFKEMFNITAPEFKEEISLKAAKYGKKILNTFLTEGKEHKLYRGYLANVIRDARAYTGLAAAQDYSLLLFGDIKNKDLIKQVAKISTLVTLDWFRYSAEDTAYNDKDAIASFLHLKNEDEVISPEAVNLISTIGTKRDDLALSLGKRITAILGISTNKDNANRHPDAIRKLQLSLGHRAIQSMIAAGYVEQIHTDLTLFEKYGSLKKSDIADKQASVVTIRIKTDKRNKPTKFVQDLIDQVDADEAGEFFDSVLVNDFERAPSDLPITFVNEKIKNSVFKLTDSIKEFVKKQQQVAWKFSDSANLMNSIPVDLLKEHLGFKDTATTQVNRLKEVEGVNRSIESGIKHFKSAYANNIHSVFYFAYRVWSNSRFGMASTTLNPQGNKLHRHTLVIRNNIKTIKRSEEDIAFRAWRTGIAMAFGTKDVANEETAKNNFYDLLERDDIRQAVHIINRDATELSAEDSKIILDVINSGGEGMYTMDALVSIAKYLTDVNGPEFTTSFTIETDGITNGAILGILQAPLDDTSIEWLRKGGLIFTGDLFEENADIRETTEDAYKTLAEDIITTLDSMVKSAKENKQELFEIAKQIVGSFRDDTGAITSSARELMKSPLMVFFYGSGMTAIKRKFYSNVMNNFWLKLETATPENYEEIVAPFERLLRMKFPAYADRLKFEFSKSAEERIERTLNSTYSAALGTTMESTFSNMLQYRNVLLDNMNMQFEIFNDVYTKALTKYKNRRGLPANALLSTEQVSEVLDSISDYIPGFSNPNDPNMRVQGVKEILITKYQEAGEKDFNLSSQVQTTFQQSPSMTDAVKQKDYVEANVATLVKGVHTLDSSIIQDTLNEFVGLILHDAGLYAADEAVAGTHKYNETFFNKSENYFLGRELSKRLTQMYKKYRSQAGENADKNLDQFNKKMFKSAISRANRKGVSNAMFLKLAISNDKEIKGLFAESFVERMKQNFKLLATVDEHRKKVLDSVKSVQQAAMPMKETVYQTGKEGVVPESFGKPLYENTNIIRIYKMYSEMFPATSKSNSNDLNEQLAVAYAMLDNLEAQQITPELQENINYVKSDIDRIEQMLNSSEGVTSVDGNPALGSFDSATQYSVTPELSESIFDNIVMQDTANNDNEHTGYLRGMLDDIINKVIKAEDNIDLRLKNHTGETGGQVAIENKDIDIALGNARPTVLSQSGTEVYLHELIHIITYNHLRNGENSAIRAEIDRLFTTAKKALTPDIFIESTNPTQAEKDAARARYDYIFNNKDLPYDEFIAYALTNKVVMEKLKQIPYESPEFSSNFFGAVQHYFYRVLEAIKEYSGRKRGENVHEELYQVLRDMHDLNERQQIINKQQWSLVHKSKQQVFNHIGRVANRIIDATGIEWTAVPGKVDTFYSALSQQPIIKKLSDLPESTAGKKIVKKFFQKDGILYKLFAQEIAGGSDVYKSMLPLLRKAKTQIDGARETVTNQTIAYVNTLLHEDTTEYERELLTKVLIDLDMTTLQDYKFSDVHKLLLNDDVLQKEIEIVGKSILNGNPELASNINFILDQVEGLGAYKATGNLYTSRGQLDSAYALVSFLKRNELVTTTGSDLENSLAKLVTLYGIKHTSRDTKNEFIAFHKGNIDLGMPVDFAEQLITQYANSRNSLKRGTIEHGYTKEVYDGTISSQFALVEDEADLKKKGYVLAHVMPNMKRDGLPVALYVSKIDRQIAYNHATYSLTQHRVSRFNLLDIYKQQSGYNEAEDNYFSDTTQKALNVQKGIEKNLLADLARKRRTFDGNPKGSILMGNSGAHLAIPENIKRDYLGKTTSIESVLGRLSGYSSDVVASQEMNKQTISVLVDDYTQNYSPTDDDWSNIAVEYPEIYRLIKRGIASIEGTQSEAYKEFARNPRVRKELIDVVFGYRKFSITQTARFNRLKSDSLKTSLRLTEMLWEDIAKYGGVQIVIKTPEVLMGNITSNVITRMVDGTNIVTIVEDSIEAHQQLQQYRDLSQELFNIDNKIATLSSEPVKNQVEINTLTADKKRIMFLIDNLTVTPLIRAGVFQSITEDIDTSHYTKGFLANLNVTKKVNQNAKEYAKVVFDNVFMTQNTKAFQFLMRSTQESDFWARYSRYKQLKAEGELIDEEIMNEVMEDYIHYDAPTSKPIQYGNDMGIVRFTKFLFRSQRVQAKKLKKNTGNVLGIVGLQHMLWDYEDIFDSNLLLTGKGVNKVTNIPNAPEQAIETAIDPRGLSIALDVLGFE